MKRPRKESERQALRASPHSSKPLGGRLQEGLRWPLGLGGDDIPLFIEGKNRVHDVDGLVDHLHQSQIVGMDQTLRHHLLAHPLQQAMPEPCADQNDGNAAGFARLYEGDDFAQLIKRPESAGQNDIGIGVFDESDFACKEVAE